MTVLIDTLQKYTDLNVFYDIGAHDGQFTKDHSRIYKNAQFHMFEASPGKKAQKGGEWHNVVLSHTDGGEVDFHVSGS